MRLGGEWLEGGEFVARKLTDDESQIHRKLWAQITSHYQRNKLRTNYVEGDRYIENSDYRMADGRLAAQVPLYWPAKAIEVFSSRLRPRGFSHDSTDLVSSLEVAYADSSADMAESLAIKSALRHGPSFVFASRGNTAAGEPDVIVSAQSALTASCLIDSRSRRVTAALELMEGLRANLYLPGRVLHLERGMLATEPIVHDEWGASRRVMCAPFIHGMSIEKPFGSSRVTNSVMGFTDAAVRTFMRQEISADWYQNPRERLFGVDPESFDDTAPGWVRRPGAIDALPDIHPDDDPEIPDSLRRATMTLYPQMTMQPFSDQFRLIASQFSGASSIPLQYLGIVQDSNPTSAQAIEAQDVDLVRAVEDQQPAFSWARRMLAVNILTLLHGDLDPAALRGLAARWHDPRHRGVMEQGQFVAQQVQAGNLQPGSPTTLGLLPISDGEARAAAEEYRRGRADRMLEALTAVPGGDAGS